VDWDHDGRKDLITGENNGHIRVYLNTGTDAAPVFNGYFLIIAGGVTFDCGSYSWMHVADWNNDKLWDIICGGTDGMLRLLINVGSPSTAVFNSFSYIKDGSVNLDVGSRSSPTTADWNRDGKKDLIVGASAGYIYYLENIGTDIDPIFNGKKQLEVNGSPIDVGFDSHPDVVDWNNDGVIDIITGEFYGNLLHYLAIGPLSLSSNVISAKAGKKIQFNLDSGKANSSRKYILLGSTSGSEPGIPLPGGQAVLPVNWDAFTSIMASMLNTTVFNDFLGTLDANGEASSVMAMGPLPHLVIGQHFNFAYVLNNPWDYASNSASIEIVP